MPKCFYNLSSSSCDTACLSLSQERDPPPTHSRHLAILLVNKQVRWRSAMAGLIHLRVIIISYNYHHLVVVRYLCWGISTKVVDGKCHILWFAWVSMARRRLCTHPLNYYITWLATGHPERATYREMINCDARRIWIGLWCQGLSFIW